METPLLLSRKGGNGHLLGDTFIEPIVFVTQTNIFIEFNQPFREKRVKMVELLTSMGAKTTSTPCKLPVFEIKSDPLFRSVADISSTDRPTKPSRDPPPWSTSPPSTRVVQNGTHPTPIAPYSNGVRQATLFKVKPIDPSDYGPRPWSPPAAIEVAHQPDLQRRDNICSKFFKILYENQLKQNQVPAEPVLPKGGPPAMMREVVWRPVSSS